ncbi:hypothetical protein [Marinoscillum pacificum]|uniref:hypothetical protein n=1 Tax=Marinoscillum pacificum TaxID=392723 RepID=UPI00215849C5|nr:hypothetical protein [Marinoscillum pacificum]
MKETSFGYEQALEKIKGIGQKPIVIEIQWDGDTQGWFIMMFLITESGFWKFKRTHVHHLGNISSGHGDLRLFNGQVPPWPEAKQAMNIAEELKKELELEIYFPSPNEPDDDCPRWWEQDKAIHCADCNKLIIPTTSPYLSKEVCYNCHLKRKRKNREDIH